MPPLDSSRTWILLAGALCGYLLLMFASPVRASLRDGLRCVRRYGTLWSMLALLGLCYALFKIGLDVFCHYILPEGARPIFQWTRPWFYPHPMLIETLRSSALPALECVAGVFNNLITTFPFSAIAALMLLANWQGHHAVLRAALRRRFDGLGWLIYHAISICALAAIVKPALYLSLPVLGRMGPSLHLLQIETVIEWLSFLFEYLFGVCVQLYLILLVYVWVRGLNFTHSHLLDFAIRRFSFVVKWAGVVMLVSTVFIHVPLILSNVPPFSHWIPPERTFVYIERIARPVLAVFLVFFSSVQITLTFHSESLRKAVRDHLGFVGRNWWALGWFLLVAGIHFYLLNALDRAMNLGFGSGTAVTLAWRVAYPLLGAFVGGWMLATWVCLYKRCVAGRVDADSWVRF